MQDRWKCPNCGADQPIGTARCGRCHFEPVGLEAGVSRAALRSHALRFTWRDIFSREVALGIVLVPGIFAGITVAFVVLLLLIGIPLRVWTMIFG